MTAKCNEKLLTSVLTSSTCLKLFDIEASLDWVDRVKAKEKNMNKLRLHIPYYLFTQKMLPTF